jgi:hypothetical protein
MVDGTRQDSHHASAWFWRRRFQETRVPCGFVWSLGERPVVGTPRALPSRMTTPQAGAPALIERERTAAQSTTAPADTTLSDAESLNPHEWVALGQAAGNAVQCAGGRSGVICIHCINLAYEALHAQAGDASLVAAVRDRLADFPTPRRVA